MTPQIFSSLFFRWLLQDIGLLIYIHCRYLCYQKLFHYIVISEKKFYQILPTCNVSFIFRRHDMLDSLVMLHYIAAIQCYLQGQLTFYVIFYSFSYRLHLMLSGINVSNTYVITTGYLLPKISIYQGRKISNILCQIILISNTFQRTLAYNNYFQHLC